MATLDPELEVERQLELELLNGTKAVAKPRPPIFFEDDDFYKVWSGRMILGPFVIAIFCIIVIITGQLMLQTWTGTCGFPLPTFISAAIAVCYMFLMLYSWIFIGEKITIELPQMGIKKFTIIQPFQSLKVLMVCYVILGVTAFIVWIVGTAILNMAFYCILTAPELYAYCTFLIATFWLGFTIIMSYLIKFTYGTAINAVLESQLKPPTMEELEDRIFIKQFNNFDKQKESKIPHASLSPLLQALGVYVPDKELPDLIKTLDPAQTGVITYDDMYAWFKKMNAAANTADSKDAGGSVGSAKKS